MTPIPEWSGPFTREALERELLPAYAPRVLRGLVRDWPLVAVAADPEAQLRLLLAHDRGHPVDALLARPDAARQVGFAEDGEGFNFVRDRRPLAQVVEQLWRYRAFEAPPMLAAQSIPVAEHLPGLLPAHHCALVAAPPRLWLGNRVTVPAHFDDSHNLACVAGGRRRFTLLPPQAAPLLYLAAPDRSPTAAPTSRAALHQPDFTRFPLLRDALAMAQQAELGPGDAIYIPPLWFHQVEALEPVNLLLNQWWRAPRANGATDDLHLAALRLAMLALRELPGPERAGWQALFAHYVFGAEDLTHLSAAQRGLFGPVSAELEARERAELAARLKP